MAETANQCSKVNQDSLLPDSQTTSLTETDLDVANEVASISSDENDSDLASTSSGKTGCKDMFKDLLKLSYPLILCELFQNLLLVVSTAFVGNLSTDDLSAAALATTWFNIWNVSMIGFMSAIDTFLTQSYGAKQYELYSTWTGNSILIVSIATIVTSGFMALCGSFMHLVVKDASIAREAGLFALRLIPGLFPLYWYRVLSKYLQIQNIMAPTVAIGILANGVNVACNWGLMYQAEWGIAGSAWATTLTRTSQFMMMLMYMLWKKNTDLKQTWPSVTYDNNITSAIGPFMQIASQGALALFFDSVFWEIFSFMASYLGTASLAAYAIGINLTSFIFLSFPLAIGNATCILVGRNIGNQRPADAKEVVKVSFCFVYAIEVVIILITLVFRDELAGLFTKDESVSELVKGLIPILCIMMVNDATYGISCGTFTGLGRQNLLLYVTLIQNALISLPLAYCLAFIANLGVHGLMWAAVVGGLFCVSICVLLLLFGVDWHAETTKAMRRLSSTTGQREISDERANTTPLLHDHAQSNLTTDSLGLV